MRDILLYGCNVATGPEGAEFLATVSGLTGANVAASATPTGPRSLGGDWILETATGTIEASPLPLNIQSLPLLLYTTVHGGDLNEDGWLVANGELDGNYVQKPGSVRWQSGAVWRNQYYYTINSSSSFVTWFSMRMNGQHGDGMTFAISPSVYTLGRNLYELGYGGILSPLAVEFDTWGNAGGWDGGYNHIAALGDGNVTNHLAVGYPSLRMYNNTSFVRVAYSASNYHLTVEASTDLLGLVRRFEGD